ncbi:hypothetical protein E6O75_ATG00769 [Venturia nashicola]|uniref:Uncharacterized protein n=1 Tax=Venturia nashicola TaxID=86259 RepID=A0A4Z1PXU2_9PEZI|nr:hypothetical protein E6O75_ATG00769 [Venturia nashicola]
MSPGGGYAHESTRLAKPTTLLTKISSQRPSGAISVPSPKANAPAATVTTPVSATDSATTRQGSISSAAPQPIVDAEESLLDPPERDETGTMATNLDDFTATTTSIQSLVITPVPDSFPADELAKCSPQILTGTIAITPGFIHRDLVGS